MSRPPVTCHVLDTTQGRPAAGIVCAIYKLSDDPSFLLTEKETELFTEIDSFAEKTPFAIATTNSDGRVGQWIFNEKYPGLAEKIGYVSKQWSELKPGVYKIRFHTKSYFNKETHQTLSTTFFPFVEIHFIIKSPPDAHYHIPLLLSNHSYSTYRGS